MQAGPALLMIVPSVSRATRNRTGVIDHHAAAPAGAVSQGLVVASPLSVTHTAESEGKGEGGRASGRERNPG